MTNHPISIALVSMGLLGACMSTGVDDESSGMQYETSPGSNGSNGTPPDAGSGSAAMRCCSVHWYIGQSCQTDSSGLPVVATKNHSPSEIFSWDKCADSYSSRYDGTANGSRCIDKNEQWLQPRGPEAGRWYSYKVFEHGRFLAMVPDTAEGERECNSIVFGYSVGLKRGGF